MFLKHATQNEDYAMCIFAAQDIINAINAINVNIEVQDRQLFMDGTFKVRDDYVIFYGEFILRKCSYYKNFCSF